MSILVTGASAGFGEAICRELVKQGYQVIGAARRLDRLKLLEEDLGELFYPLCMDVSSTKSVDQALNSLPEAFKEIDCLVNNAGLALGQSPVYECDFKDWLTVIQTNVIGLTYLTHQLLPVLMKQPEALIINMGSIAGSYPYPGGHIYGATKAFVKQFSLNLRADLNHTHVRVTNIEPGLCGDTEFSYVRYQQDEEKVKSIYENIDFIRPEDIANTVLWVYECPAHMNINRIEIMPQAQASAPLNVHRRHTKL